VQPSLPPDDPALPTVVEVAPAAPPSHAAEQTTAEPSWVAPSGPPRRRWYGWQTLIVDVGDFGVWGAATLVGYAAAVVIDAAVLAHEDVGASRGSAMKLRPFEWSPDIRPSREGGTAGVRGSF
jgi:hypothetical protein